MFDLYGCYFMYGDFNSEDYDLVFGNMDTSRLMALEASKNINTVRSRKHNVHYVNRVSYVDEPISFEAEIFTKDATPIMPEDMATIERALFGRHSYTKLYQIFPHEDNRTYINCILTNPEKIESTAGVVGYKFVVNTDSVMAWEEQNTQEVVFDGNDTQFTIIVKSDLNDYIYPEVEFEVGTSGGDITLYNDTDDATRFTSFSSVPASTSFTMKGAINHLTDGMYDYFTDRNFIRLVNGENNFYFTGDLDSVTFKFNNRKYM